MNTFFTSDTHYDHKNIIKLAQRPYFSVEHMNIKLVENWNRVVRPGDMVYHLGDFAWHRPKEFRAQLNGDIRLTRGNHDPDGNFAKFQWVKDMYTAEVGDQKIVLCHYALRTWQHDIKGAWHLFGHTHGNLPPFGKSFDIGVDAMPELRPYEFEEVKQIMDRRDIGDHPGGATWQHAKNRA